MRIKSFKRIALAILVSFWACNPKSAQEITYYGNYITKEHDSQAFPLIQPNKTIHICYSSNDYEGVEMVLNYFSKDLTAVGQIPVKIHKDTIPDVPNIILVGTLGKNPWLDSLATQKHIATSVIQNKWEASLIQVVENPFKSVQKALIIAGSDKRGTIYGMFDLSEKIGVSPWYWWADVPIIKQETLNVKPGIFTNGEPKVKYRGIFLNDEAPALSGWVHENYGSFNHEFYQQIFELILRLKGNYLWPAMWGRAFNADDTLNPVLANKMGIVMGTSHHEPMMRAQQEWKLFGNGAWNYDKNQEVLAQFWTNGIRNMGKHESIVTIGMRGDGDMPMTEESNIDLLEKIVSNQRQIIEKVTEKPASAQPQIWALYKEVQEYYDKGMRVPDDVTLLLCDDNWGNIRKLPNAKERLHAGGYGIYYHFDYVGDPRNYKWINTNLIPRVWEQMRRAYAYGVNQIWLVNVGDLKPMELPISFFLDLSWNPENYPLQQLNTYTENWASQQFGPGYAKEIAYLLNKYTQFNARRKPEMLDANTYSLVNYLEFERVTREYNQLAAQATELKQKLDDKFQDAYYQLVLFPILASSNLNQMYYTVARNQLYASQNRILANVMADSVVYLFKKDSLLTYHYNHTMANGKWNHMMDQTHIGYTNWQQPDYNKLPEITYLARQDKPNMGVTLDGSKKWWPNDKTAVTLPELNPTGPQKTYIEIFNQGNKSFTCKLESSSPFALFDKEEQIIADQKRFKISIDWLKVPIGRSMAEIKVISDNQPSVAVKLPIYKPSKKAGQLPILVNNTLAFEASQFSTKTETDSLHWLLIPNYGKTESGITTHPFNQPPNAIEKDSPSLSYAFYAADTGMVEIHTILSPTLDFMNASGLKFGLALQNETPKLLNMHTQSNSNNWSDWVGNNCIETVSFHKIINSGANVITFYRVDDGVVLQKIILSKNKLKTSYLGTSAN